jgi:hypothetical protein
MREHHTVVDPGPYFVDRVIARLPRSEDLMLAWAARRVLPVTLALAAVLSVAVVASSGSSRRAAATASTPISQQANDPLDWLLEGGQGLR